ncbi:hypothetical protein C8Q80DRAFT_659801 [Daedaleopsis nitida]|nr:hypothetical protein C8Q80DRAFT_659801 [Daedaleopsis nitida]
MSDMNATANAGQPPSGSSPMAMGLDRTFGALLLGAFFSVILYGIVVHQTYRYFRLYPKDAVSIRIIVVSLFILETLQVAFSIHTSYFYLVTNYFKPDALVSISVPYVILIAVTGALITAISQLFFLRRVSLIAFKYKVVSVIAIGFLIAALVGDTLLSIYGFTERAISVYTGNESKWLLAMTFSALTIVNILVTGSLIAVLRRARENETTKESYINLFVIYVINTGFLILILDAVSLILAVSFDGTLYWVAFHLVAARLYTNTLLSVLNSRKLNISRGMDVFDAGTYGSGIITRATRLAAVERWNVPQVPDDVPPR